MFGEVNSIFFVVSTTSYFTYLTPMQLSEGERSNLN